MKQLKPKMIFIACAALGREVKGIIQKYGWDADFEAIDARLHLHPKKIGPAVEMRLEKHAGQYERRVVVYGQCGSFDLDDILEGHGAVRPRGPHCFEMYGGELYTQALREEPGTYVLTDYLIRAWDVFVVRGLKIDRDPKLKELLFRHHKRLLYFSQEEDEALITKAHEIAAWLNLPLTIKHVGYGDLERRLVAVVEGQPQTTPNNAFDHYGQVALVRLHDADPADDARPAD